MENIGSAIRLSHLPIQTDCIPQKLFPSLLPSSSSLSSSSSSSLLSSSIEHQDAEILLLVAPPASGKSTLAKRLVNDYGYVRINQDESGSLSTCMQQAKEALEQRRKVVIDNTNLNPITRQHWFSLARQYQVQVTL